MNEESVSNPPQPMEEEKPKEEPEVKNEEIPQEEEMKTSTPAVEENPNPEEKEEAMEEEESTPVKEEESVSVKEDEPTSVKEEESTPTKEEESTAAKEEESTPIKEEDAQEEESLVMAYDRKKTHPILDGHFINDGKMCVWYGLWGMGVDGVIHGASSDFRFSMKLPTEGVEGPQDGIYNGYFWMRINPPKRMTENNVSIQFTKADSIYKVKGEGQNRLGPSSWAPTTPKRASFSARNFTSPSPHHHMLLTPNRPNPNPAPRASRGRPPAKRPRSCPLVPAFTTSRTFAAVAWFRADSRARCRCATSR